MRGVSRGIESQRRVTTLRHTSGHRHAAQCACKCACGTVGQGVYLEKIGMGRRNPETEQDSKARNLTVTTHRRRSLARISNLSTTCIHKQYTWALGWH